MISRGSLIGKIVDDIASLKFQIETRNKLGYTDLSLFCEDFFREVLNITYGLNMINLNATRSNNPGLDLGDEKAKIAYQITSNKKSEKVNGTLEKITKEQKDRYQIFKILILGKKQNSYSIDESTLNFGENDIMDLDDLLKSIVILNIDKLKSLFDLFKLEFRIVKVEFEIVDSTGNFESSYGNIAEKIANRPPKNGLLYFESKDDGYEEAFQEILDLYNRLARVPKISRELLYFIVKRGKQQSSDGKFWIMPEILERIFGMSSTELLVDINILENEYLVGIYPDDIDGRDIHRLTIRDENLNYIFQHLLDKKQSIRTFLNTLDFTILDEEE